MLLCAEGGPLDLWGRLGREVQRPEVVVWRETWRRVNIAVGGGRGDAADGAVPSEHYLPSRLSVLS